MICIVTIYKSNLNLFEKISLRRICKLFYGYIHIVCPESLNTSHLDFLIPEYKVERFDDKYFKSIHGYNELLLSEEFYTRFINHKYLLIAQLDVFIFKNEIKNWCDQEYSYVGAPMPDEAVKGIKKKYSMDFNTEIPFKTDKMLNGGFSLRKTKDLLDVVTKNKKFIDTCIKFGWFEDTVLSLLMANNSQYFLPEMEISRYFSIETYPVQHFIKMNYVLPVGCHAWYRNDKKMYNNFFWFKQVSKTQKNGICYAYFLLCYFYWFQASNALIKRIKRLKICQTNYFSHS